MMRPIAITILYLVLGLMTGMSPALAAEPSSNQTPWEEWLAGVRAEALERGIRPEIVESALTGIKPIERAIQNDRNQPEMLQTVRTYVSQRVSAARIENGRKFLAQHRDTLDAVAARYGVQARYIVAIWGMETNYGLYPLSYDAVTALATMAYDPRRSRYFRKELFAALQILNEGHIAHADMKGSWAGAMGQSQFMPTSFLGYAQDFDGDGKRNIWTSEADVFASIANYLAKHGWKGDHYWGRQVTLPEKFAVTMAELMPQKPRGCRGLKTHTRKLSLQEWNDLGVRRLNGTDLPARNLQASLVTPDGVNGPAFLTYGNFRAILGYNCANLYAIGVGTLAEKIK